MIGGTLESPRANSGPGIPKWDTYGEGIDALAVQQANSEPTPDTTPSVILSSTDGELPAWDAAVQEAAVRKLNPPTPTAEVALPEAQLTLLTPEELPGHLKAEIDEAIDNRTGMIKKRSIEERIAQDVVNKFITAEQGKAFRAYVQKRKEDLGITEFSGTSTSPIPSQPRPIVEHVTNFSG